MEGTTWKNTFSTMKTLVSTGGIASLYRGMVPRTFRLCGAFFVCLMVRDVAIEFKTRLALEEEAAMIYPTAANVNTPVVAATSPSSPDAQS
jgi:hypothetical protein